MRENAKRTAESVRSWKGVPGVVHLQSRIRKAEARQRDDRTLPRGFESESRSRCSKALNSSVEKRLLACRTARRWRYGEPPLNADWTHVRHVGYVDKSDLANEVVLSISSSSHRSRKVGIYFMVPLVSLVCILAPMLGPLGPGADVRPDKGICPFLNVCEP